MFSSLIGSILLAGLLVTGPVLIHFYWYKPNPTPHRRYVLDNVEAWLFWAAANLLVSWWLALLINLAPVVALSGISLGWGHVSESVKNGSELYNSVKGTIKPPFYAASGWVSWIIIFESIYNLYDGNDESQSYASYTPRVWSNTCCQISPTQSVLALSSRPVLFLPHTGDQRSAYAFTRNRIRLPSNRFQRAIRGRCGRAQSC